MRGGQCWELGGWGGRGDAGSKKGYPGPALLHRSRSLQKIKKVTWSESRDTGMGAGREIALPTAGGITRCGVFGPTVPGFGVTG